MPTIDAGTNPALANQIINDVINGVTAEDAPPAPKVQAPPDCVVDLPGGYLTPAGEVVTTAEVRELTGRDEEVISRTTSLSATLQAVLTRGVVSVGGMDVTPDILDSLLSGDRDWLLINIYSVTFGSEIKLTPYCPACDARVEAEMDILTGVPIKPLANQSDRRMLIKYSKGTVAATLPTGRVQRQMMEASEKTSAELSTILLSGCVVEMNDLPLFNAGQVLDLPIRDRRKITEQIIEHTPGPQLSDITVDCPQCSTTLEVPLSMAALFQF